VAHLGVLMLLFTVGLKLRVKQVAQRQVVGGALLHFGISTLVFAPGFRMLLGLDWNTAVLLGMLFSLVTGGMGRTGSAANQQVLREGLRPIGLDADHDRAAGHQGPAGVSSSRTQKTSTFGRGTE